VTAVAQVADATLPRPRPSVAWLGRPPAWVPEGVSAAESLAELASLDVSAVHASAAWAPRLGQVRRAAASARIVLDLSESGPELGRGAAAAAAAADVILLPTLQRLERFRARHAELAGRTSLFRPPLDLEACAPEATLVETRSRDLKRLRRLHRLAGPIVLYVGPYTEAGGLATAIAVASEIHARRDDVRLVAIPDGPVDRRYLDRCERSALGLGHHGIVEWNAVPDELPLWFALAAVVVAPDTEPAGAPRALRAAAAGRPFVGGRFPAAAEVVAHGETGLLLDLPVDTALLAQAVESLLDDPEHADRLGAAGRERAEAAVSHEAAVRKLATIWSGRAHA
jgi:glycosyltransferase involved in cell wall biosynthesis